MLMPQPSSTTGSSVHLVDAVQLSLINDQDVRVIGHGPFLGAAEAPKTVATTDLEADDIVIAYAIKVFLHKHLTQSLQVSWVQQVQERAR